MTQKKPSPLNSMFIVKLFSYSFSPKPKYESLSGIYYFKSDLRFVNVLEEPISYDLYVKFLNLIGGSGMDKYFIVELTQPQKGF